MRYAGLDQSPIGGAGAEFTEQKIPTRHGPREQHALAHEREEARDDLDRRVMEKESSAVALRERVSALTAEADMLDSPQGFRAFLRAYYHMKSADWTQNRPAPLAPRALLHGPRGSAAHADAVHQSRFEATLLPDVAHRAAQRVGETGQSGDGVRSGQAA